MNVKYVKRLKADVLHWAMKKKKKQNIMYLCEVVLNLDILMMKNYAEASILKKCIPHFNLNKKMSCHTI